MGKRGVQRKGEDFSENHYAFFFGPKKGWVAFSQQRKGENRRKKGSVEPNGLANWLWTIHQRSTGPKKEFRKIWKKSTGAGAEKRVTPGKKLTGDKYGQGRGNGRKKIGRPSRKVHVAPLQNWPPFGKGWRGGKGKGKGQRPPE